MDNDLDPVIQDGPNKVARHLNPRFSVIINVLNGERFLERAINSVLCQSYRDFELVIWDNNSSDETAEICRKAAQSDERVVVRKAHFTTTLYEARNRAFDFSSGELIAFLDFDDTWERNKLKIASLSFESGRTDVFYSNFHILNLTENISTKAYRAPLPEGSIQEKIARNYSIALSTIVFRRSVLEKLKGPFDSRFTVIGDFDACFRLAGFAKFAASNAPLVSIGKHANNLSLTSTDARAKEIAIWIDKERTAQSANKRILNNAHSALLFELYLLGGKGKIYQFLKILTLCMTSRFCLILPSKFIWWLKNQKLFKSFGFNINN